MKLLHIFAQMPTVPWPVTTQWLLGLIGAAAAVALGLNIANQARKLWGRRPPIDEDLRRLEASIKGELKDQTSALTSSINHIKDRTEESIAVLQADRERNWKDLGREISELRSEVAFIRGQLDRGGYQ